MVEILHLYGMALDGDAAFALQIHIVEYLVLQVFLGNGFGVLQQAVGQGTFTMVYMGYDTKVAYILH